MIGRYPPKNVRSDGPLPWTNRTTGNGPVPLGVRRSPTRVNSPDWKVISSILAGWGCFVQAGRSSRLGASRTADSLVEMCLKLEMILVFIVTSLWLSGRDGY